MTTGAASTPTPIFEVGQGTKTMVSDSLYKTNGLLFHLLFY